MVVCQTLHTAVPGITIYMYSLGDFSSQNMGSDIDPITN